jgi:tetratricopeptide (TPR) repeat protein
MPASGDRLQDLRVRVATEPEDLGARRELARLELEAGRPGAALRQLAVLERNGELGGERQVLARLLGERGRARLRLGDGDAVDDFDHAHRLDRAQAVDPEAVFGAIMAALRAGERERALALAARARRLAPGDVRLSFADPQAPMARVGEAAMWLWRGGARRAALALLDRYGELGGGDREVLAAWVAARGWWRGTGGGFDLLTRRRLVAAGVSLCPVAADPGDDGCAGTLDRVAEHADEALAVYRRADARRWRTADADEARAWSAIAAQAWRAGLVGSWSEAMSARVESYHELPGIAPPEPPAAPVRTPAQLRRWRALLAGDPSLQEASTRLLAAWGVAVDEARTAARGSVAPAPAPAPASPPFGLAVPAARPELAPIAEAFAREPALADRLAGDWVDRGAAVSERAPAVAELFLRLGDPARALTWADKAVAESPRHPPLVHLLGRVAAAAGLPVRAQVHFIEAAARSGDAGAYDLEAAGALLRAGYPIEALTAARRALGESAPGEEGAALEVVAAADRDAGRTADAERACSDQLARIPERFRADWRSRRDRALAGPTTLAAPDDGELAAAWAPRLADAGKRDQAIDVLRTAARWQADDARPRTALLALLPPEDPRWADAAAELLLIGLAARPAQAVPALQAFADAADRLGDAALARAARAEARGLDAVSSAAARGCSRRTPAR